MKPTFGESPMHFTHRLQRAAARRVALDKFPKVYVTRVWVHVVDGIDQSPDFGGYQDHPEYAAEYFKQLKIVRALRFGGDIV